MISAQELLADRKKQGLASLIGYFPAGFPSVQKSIEAAVAMCSNGVDVLELGVPYSDPVMDGPLIQNATVQALEAGFKLEIIFEIIRGIRSQVDTPILVMSYWNPIIQFGMADFCEKLVEVGGCGVITPDLIVDEAALWLETSEKYNLERVFLATPTSAPARISAIVEASQSFVYCVSTMGITGTRDGLDAKARTVVKNVQEVDSEIVCAVGIGVSTPDQVKEVTSYADAAIVGSAFVRAYSQGGLDSLVEITRKLAEGKNR